MFGLFDREGAQPLPDEPVQIRMSIEIDRPAADVYRLLDWGDDDNQMRARGCAVVRENADPEVFRLTTDRAPGLEFLFTVVAAQPGQRYAYISLIVPSVGRRIDALEVFDLAPLGNQRCKVTFTNTIRHLPGLTEPELADEVNRSSLAAFAGLEKLKLQAEEGPAAVVALERLHG